MPWCDATCDWRRRVFQRRPSTPIRRNSQSLCSTDLSIPWLTPLEMRKVQVRTPLVKGSQTVAPSLDLRNVIHQSQQAIDRHAVRRRQDIAGYLGQRYQDEGALPHPGMKDLQIRGGYGHLSAAIQQDVHVDHPWAPTVSFGASNLRLDLSAVQSVVIYCRPFHVVFAVATLESAGG